ncbi:M28 family metallopeptidase [Lysobacter panacisoli]|uniref:Peptidase M28 domain-containing protein n=1 Tax=Lysobacter panacisoli TaxID=1255263 RepID=A0ABP9LCM3_9GAMM|nr:M28 family peptidase [Lysobacter panacisoli]
MRRLKVALLPILFLSTGLTAVQAREATPPPGQWLEDVRSIADAGDNAQRRAAIGARLKALGLEAQAVPFEARQREGENLIAEVAGPSSAPLLLIGAHSDRVEAGDGATDNASGSATVLALAERFRAKPLKHHRVAVAFWDLEEAGLLGSKAYVDGGSTRPALYVNFDVFGWGDTLWMMAPANQQAALVETSRAATKAQRIGFSPGEHYPPTDHLPFVRAGWPAVSYSLVDAEEVAKVLGAYAGKSSPTPAKVMQVIHSENDTIDQIDAKAVARGVDAVEQALRLWDAQAVTTTPTTTSGSGE